MNKPAFYRHKACYGGRKAILLGRMRLRYARMWAYVLVTQDLNRDDWTLCRTIMHPSRNYIPWTPTEDQIDLVVEGLTAAVEQEADPSMGIKYISWLGKLKNAY